MMDATVKQRIVRLSDDADFLERLLRHPESVTLDEANTAVDTCEDMLAVARQLQDDFAEGRDQG